MYKLVKVLVLNTLVLAALALSIPRAAIAHNRFTSSDRPPSLDERWAQVIPGVWHFLGEVGNSRNEGWYFEGQGAHKWALVHVYEPKLKELNEKLVTAPPTEKKVIREQLAFVTAVHEDTQRWAGQDHTTLSKANSIGTLSHCYGPPYLVAQTSIANFTSKAKAVASISCPNPHQARTRVSVWGNGYNYTDEKYAPGYAESYREISGQTDCSGYAYAAIDTVSSWSTSSQANDGDCH